LALSPSAQTQGELRRLYRRLMDLIIQFRGHTWRDKTHGFCIGETSHHYGLHADGGGIEITEYFGRKTLGQPQRFELLLNAVRLARLVKLAAKRYHASERGGPAVDEERDTFTPAPPPGDGWDLVSISPTWNAEKRCHDRTYTWARVVFAPAAAPAKAAPAAVRAEAAPVKARKKAAMPAKPAAANTPARISHHLAEAQRFLADLRTELAKLGSTLEVHKFPSDVIVVERGEHLGRGQGRLRVRMHAYNKQVILEEFIAYPDILKGKKPAWSIPYEFCLRDTRWLYDTVQRELDQRQPAVAQGGH
jgi:hypothetical protein